MKADKYRSKSNFFLIKDPEQRKCPKIGMGSKK
jgi:hypothetical protein